MGALAAALVLTRAAEPGRWGWARVAALAAVLVATYAVFSEWMNAGLLRNWQHSEWMPVLAFGGVRIGSSPLLQSVLVPPLALWFARTGAPPA